MNPSMIRQFLTKKLQISKLCFHKILLQVCSTYRFGWKCYYSSPQESKQFMFLKMLQALNTLVWVFIMKLHSHVCFEQKDTVVQSFFMKRMDVVVWNISRDQTYVTVVLTRYFRQVILLLFCLCHHSLKIYCIWKAWNNKWWKDFL